MKRFRANAAALAAEEDDDDDDDEAGLDDSAVDMNDGDDTGTSMTERQRAASNTEANRHINGVTLEGARGVPPVPPLPNGYRQ